MIYCNNIMLAKEVEQSMKEYRFDAMGLGWQYPVPSKLLCSQIPLRLPRKVPHFSLKDQLEVGDDRERSD